MPILRNTILPFTMGCLVLGGHAQANNNQANDKMILLDEIIVTATKRAENIQDVAISITSFSGDFIAKSDIQDLQELSQYAPNFSIVTSSQATNARIIIRGIGSAGNSGIEPAVGVFIDGVYYPRPGSVLGNLVDIQSVEVLRGPQGTLFGRNTAAGALNITTKDPSDETESYMQASYGNYNDYSFQAALSAPLTDRVAARLAIKYADREGYGFNSFTGQKIGERDDLTARGKFVIDWAESFTSKLIFDYAETNSGGSIVDMDPATAPAVFDATLNAIFGAGVTTVDGFDYIINQVHKDTGHDQQWGITLDNSLELGGHMLRSITSYRDWQANNIDSALRISGDVLPRNQDYTTETFSQELQILSPVGETFEYVAGLFYYHENYHIDEDFDAGADGCSRLVLAMAGAGAAGACSAAPQTPATAANFDQSLTSIAAFAQAKYHITEQFSLSLGGRYTKDDKKGSFEQTIPNPILGSLFRAAENIPDLESNDDAFTWLVNASYTPTDEVMLFATYSTGFKGGGFNSQGAGVALGRVDRTFAEETSKNIEVGIKSRLFDRRLTANITLYHTILEDFQDRSFNGISFITRNAGKRTQQGFEADFMARPTDKLSLMAAISYLDSEFDSFLAASPLPGDTAAQDLSGARPHFSPKWQTTIVADYSDNLMNSDMTWFIRPEWQYISQQNAGANTNNNPQSIQAAYSKLNLHLGLSGADDQWAITLYGKNLSNTGYCQVMFDQPLGAAFGAVNTTENTVAQRCVLGVPRTYGLSLRYNF